MKLFFRKYGAGQPLLILHGLFGQSDNWNTLAKQFGESGFEVYAIDLRNHGLSPHSGAWSYPLMVEDISELVESQKLSEIILLGHSMGGRVAMQYAMQHSTKLGKLIVADMAPKAYPPHHDTIIAALQSVDLTVVKSRHEVDQQLSLFIKDNGTKQFLLKNLYWKSDTQLDWRFNLAVIAKNYGELGKVFDSDGLRCYTPAWFIRGGQSDYILDSDWPVIQEIFPDSQLITIPDAGHWVHADQPRLFYEILSKIMK